MFATISPLEAKEKRKPVTFIVLVTHHDRQELEAEDRYFTIMPDDLPSEDGTPPLISFSDVSTLALIGHLHQQAFGYELNEQQRMAIEDLRRLGVILEKYPYSQQGERAREKLHRIGELFNNK